MTLPPDISVPDPESLTDHPGAMWRIALRRFLQRKVGVIGLALVTFMTLIAIFAPLIAPYDYRENFIGQPGAERWLPPCVNFLGCEGTQHLMGLDGNVRDFFSRVIYAARVSLPLGFTTVLIAIVIGTLIGAIAGFFGGWTDNILMRVMDVVLGFPSLILAIAIGRGCRKLPIPAHRPYWLRYRNPQSLRAPRERRSPMTR
jgi:ABC-type dipeptide/oligopeptide/nickel transport system permease subunit